jgi:UDP:flavonoid glycosyltransferase YjiC (YdhE family)
VRILFTFMGGNGHFVPLVSVAKAAREAGHTVVFACGPSMVAMVEAAGFTVFALGTDTPNPPERLPLRPLDAAREDKEFREGFARRGAQGRVPLLLALCAEWQPEVLVGDEADFGHMVVGERLRLPYVTVLVMAAGSFVRAEVVGEALNELRAMHDLPPDPTLEMLHKHLVLSPFPPSFRDPAYPLPNTAHHFCPTTVEPGAPAPSWLAAMQDKPIVYFTLGTVFNMESGDLFRRVLDGLRELPVNVVMTVGKHIDPAEFGEQSAAIHIERYMAQELILSHCSLVVSHAGSGSVAGAFAYGKPMVLIPMGADQPLNAERCVAVGVARMLDPMTATPENVREAVSIVLIEPSYRRAAERLRVEFAALPGPEAMVGLLEGMRTGRNTLLPTKIKD